MEHIAQRTANVQRFRDKTKCHKVSLMFEDHQFQYQVYRTARYLSSTLNIYMKKASILKRHEWLSPVQSNFGYRRVQDPVSLTPQFSAHPSSSWCCLHFCFPSCKVLAISSNFIIYRKESERKKSWKLSAQAPFLIMQYMIIAPISCQEEYKHKIYVNVSLGREKQKFFGSKADGSKTEKIIWVSTMQRFGIGRTILLGTQFLREINRNFINFYLIDLLKETTEERELLVIVSQSLSAFEFRGI